MTSNGPASSASGKWRLSSYEEQRTPQEAITDHTEAAVHADSVRKEFTCAVCIGLLKDTVRECGHRFCEKYITTALERGNQMCPLCRTKIESERSLLHDRRMDAMITALFLNKEEHYATRLGHSAVRSGDQNVQTTENNSTES
nr:E3 ubiquitin-protein ligase RING1-like [Rhipicephalus microplus]